MPLGFSAALEVLLFIEYVEEEEIKELEVLDDRCSLLLHNGQLLDHLLRAVILLERQLE